MKMRAMLDQVDQVIECRDFRVPFTSINPLFEHVLGDKPRMIVYTKRDLAGDHKLEMQKVCLSPSPPTTLSFSSDQAQLTYWGYILD